MQSPNQPTDKVVLGVISELAKGLDGRHASSPSQGKPCKEQGKSDEQGGNEENEEEATPAVSSSYVGELPEKYQNDCIKKQIGGLSSYIFIY